MKDDETHPTEVVEEDMTEPDVDATKLLKEVITQNNPLKLANFLKEYTYDVANTRIPTNEKEIGSLNKKELRAIVQKINLCATFNITVANPNQLELLREQTFECWGKPPKEDGAWVEWCLWHHYQRQTGELLSITNAESIQERASKYIEEREKMRKEQLVETGEFENIEDIPESIRETIAGLLKPSPDQDSSELPEGEK